MKKSHHLFFGAIAWILAFSFSAHGQTTAPAMFATPVSEVAAPRIVGTALGTAGSWRNSGNTFDRATDGNPASFFDAPAPGNGDWVGIDAKVPMALSSIQYLPRPGFAGRMMNAKVQGSNSADFSDAVDLFTITSVPATGTMSTGTAHSKIGYRYFRLLFADGCYGNVSELAFFGSPMASASSEVASVPEGRPHFYVDSNTGDDKNDGKTPATAWKSPRVISDSVVVLAADETFDITDVPLVFNGKKNTWIGGDPNQPLPRLVRNQSGMMITYWTDSTAVTLANVILDSKDACATASNVRGKNVSIINVLLKNLLEGFDYTDVDGLTITDGKQIGSVAGRCHYFLKVSNLTWTGGTFGPASKQSPVRFSSPGVNGGTISNVVVTQKDSPFPIACWAIHAASNVTFNHCQSLAGDFSFDSAGAGENDLVTGCTINDLVVSEGHLNLTNISQNNVFTRPVINNSAGPCVCVSGGKGNVIDGGNFVSPKSAVFLRDASDVVVRNCVTNGGRN